MLDRPIRVSAKAVILAGGAVLLTRNLHPEDPDGDFYLLPGGGQQHGESLAHCVRREVLEETGYSVIVGDLLWIRDYIGASHEFAEYQADVHQVEVMFSCSIDATTAATELTEPDTWQLSVDWVPINRLPRLRLFPSVLVPRLIAHADGQSPSSRYLGDVN